MVVVSSDFQPLLFPALCRSGALVIPLYGNSFVKHAISRHLGNNRYLFTDGASPGVTTHWLIDREGRFRRVVPLDYRRSWARPLARIVDLVLLEAEVQPGKSLKVRELLEELQDLKASGGFQTAGHLRGFLKRKPPEAIFDASMFKEFWVRFCPELNDEEWRRQYPPAA